MLEGKLLDLVQDHIPIVSRPFAVIGRLLGAEEGQVLSVLGRLKEEGLIRQISPIYDPRRAGYDSALVAFRVRQDALEEVVRRLRSYPGVSHCYERYHTFNLWFTLAVPPDSSLSLEEVVERLSSEGVLETLVLRARRTFKIGVRLNFSSLYEREEPRNPSRNPNPSPLLPWRGRRSGAPRGTCPSWRDPLGR
jgi:DNA-binding Lrp family transcriptional regulator